MSIYYFTCYVYIKDRQKMICARFEMAMAKQNFSAYLEVKHISQDWSLIANSKISFILNDIVNLYLNTSMKIGFSHSIHPF